MLTKTVERKTKHLPEHPHGDNNDRQTNTTTGQPQTPTPCVPSLLGCVRYAVLNSLLMDQLAVLAPVLAEAVAGGSADVREVDGAEEVVDTDVLFLGPSAGESRCSAEG